MVRHMILIFIFHSNIYHIYIHCNYIYIFAIIYICIYIYCFTSQNMWFDPSACWMLWASKSRSYHELIWAANFRRSGSNLMGTKPSLLRLAFRIIIPQVKNSHVAKHHPEVLDVLYTIIYIYTYTYRCTCTYTYRYTYTYTFIYTYNHIHVKILCIIIFVSKKYHHFSWRFQPLFQQKRHFLRRLCAKFSSWITEVFWQMVTRLIATSLEFGIKVAKWRKKVADFERFESYGCVWKSCTPFYPMVNDHYPY